MQWETIAHEFSFCLTSSLTIANYKTARSEHM